MLVLIFFYFPNHRAVLFPPPQRCRIMIREQVHSEDLYTLAQAQPPKMATMTAVLLTLTHTSTHTHGHMLFHLLFRPHDDMQLLEETD